MISIITPFYQAEKYLQSAISSVLNQSFSDWELILINDGSCDQSKNIALSFSDPRIHYFEQENSGVSAARNLGLSKMNGDFFCFFDADDFLPQNSLKSRRKMFDLDNSISFVDGVVIKKDSRLEKIKNIWEPNFHGSPISDLIQLTGKSFFGPSWMIKRNFKLNYKLQENLTHAEELYFYMELAKEGGCYTFTSDCILHYRDTPNSAMKNLKGLEAGYRYIEKEVKDWDEISKEDLNIFRFKYKKAMFLAYLNQNQLKKAFKAWF